MEKQEIVLVVDIKKIAKIKSQKYDIPLNLILAIASIESRSYPYALRYEPGYFKRYVSQAPETYGYTSMETERRALAMSWGSMQIMGGTARMMGFKGVSLAELVDPEVNLEFSVKYLAHLRDKYYAEHGWEGVIAAYNAGSPRKKNGFYVNQTYVDKVNLEIRKLDSTSRLDTLREENHESIEQSTFEVKPVAVFKNTLWGKTKATFGVFQKGKMVADPASWKNAQVATNTITGFIVALVAAAPAFGYDLAMDEATIQTLAGSTIGGLAAVNWVLSTITTKKIGFLPGLPEAKDR